MPDAAAPTIVLFTLLPLLGSKVLPHWPMPGWLMLFPLLGDALARSTAPGPDGWAAISLGLLLAFWSLAVSDAATGWVRDAFPRPFPRTDPPTRHRLGAPARAIQLAGLLETPGQFIVAVEWNEAGKIDQALGDGEPVLVFNQDPREYAFRPDGAGLVGHDALIIGRGPSVAQEISRIAPHFARSRPSPAFRWTGGQPGIPLP